jgi:hypothetical protein
VDQELGRGSRRRAPISIVGIIAALLLASCGGQLPERAEPSFELPELPGEATSPPAEGGPDGVPIEAYDEIFAGALPQTTEFAGARFTVQSARVTNLHPYPMFDDPPPQDVAYGILALQVENLTDVEIDYGFDDEAFALQTWGGAELPAVHSPGVRPIDRLEPGQTATDEVAFGLPERDALADAALLIGKPPDARAAVSLSAPTSANLLPAPIAAGRPSPIHAGSIDWTILDGLASLDAPVGVCCPETGQRADDGELFAVVNLRGTVSGSLYGQTSITTDLVHLVADGVESKALDFGGEANVPEGESIDLSMSWLVPSDAGTLVLRFDGDDAGPVEVPLTIGPGSS